MPDSSLPSDDKQQKTNEVNTAAKTTYHIYHAESVHTGAGDIISEKGIGMSLLWFTTPTLNDRVFFVDCKMPVNLNKMYDKFFVKFLKFLLLSLSNKCFVIGGFSKIFLQSAKNIS